MKINKIQKNPKKQGKISAKRVMQPEKSTRNEGVYCG